MRTARYISSTLLLLLAGSTTLAERPLERAEILQIFQQLTSEPKKTWIPAGTIEATHTEYRAPQTTDPNEIASRIAAAVKKYQSNPSKKELTESLQKMQLDAIPFNVRHRLSNEYLMRSTALVRFDGERFYWEINVSSRTDSVERGGDLAGNFMTRHFDLNWNARRIFAWDGEKYTTYSLPGNHAIVDSAGVTPHAVNGPLTAGIIPWGYGYCTYEKLSAAESSAIETYVDGQTQIHLTLNSSDEIEMVFVLDPAKDYATISSSLARAGNLLDSRQFSDYELVSGNWVPTTILVNRYSAGAAELTGSDLWEITKISGAVPGPGSFDVEYGPDALVEHFTTAAESPLMYRYSQIVDTELLLAEKLSIVASEGTTPQNCATASMRYVATQLGKDVADEQLAEMVREPNSQTSLSAIKEFAEGLGLYCRAVTTDIATLKMLGGCQAILHIPGKRHFVVLAGVDNDSVWTIDLADNKFFYRTDLSFFDMDWPDGSALLVSDDPIELPDGCVDIADEQLHDIIGGSGYTCTRLLQSYHTVHCDQIEYTCIGMYEVHFTRYGCEAAESGSCSGSFMARYAECPCIDHPYLPEQCYLIWEWTYYYMRACA